jgi:CRP/FNR family transcriptional regulator, anaerobic regulatory protein
MGANPLACSTCPVRDRAACASLSDEERDELARIGRTVVLERGQTLFSGADEESGCATLISGALKISSFDADGTERILSLVHPAGFVGEMFAPVARHDVIALTDCRLCVFSGPAYARAVERFPALGRALLRRSAEDLFESRALLDLIGRRNAQAKVAGFIVAMARAASTSPCHGAATFNLPLTRGEMAGLLGITIETVSRQLSQMEQDGVVKRAGRRGLRILEPAALEALAA